MSSVSTASYQVDRLVDLINSLASAKRILVTTSIAQDTEVDFLLYDPNAEHLYFIGPEEEELFHLKMYKFDRIEILDGSVVNFMVSQITYPNLPDESHFERVRLQIVDR